MMRVISGLRRLFRRRRPASFLELRMRVPVCLNSPAGREDVVRSCSDQVARELQSRAVDVRCFFVGILFDGKLGIETRWTNPKHEERFDNEVAKALGEAFLQAVRTKLGLNANDNGQTGGAA